MSWQQSDIDTLNAAIASGIRSVAFADGRKTEYQSLDQMLAARKVIQAELDMATQSASGLVRRRVGVYNSGLGGRGGSWRNPC
ncbi:hypothetical protein ABC347_10890 [Sphingomonas sp. 1P06PA]|uniref:phage head-tail joining protein n=1 Tax=Sphingomonas sp. 1P06PA TaxID=554121 RepID=UPI0039A75567